MKKLLFILLGLFPISCFGQKVFEEVKRISFDKREYNRSNHSSEIIIQLFKIYDYSKRENSEMKLVITNNESMNEEVGVSKGVSIASAGKILGLGFSDNKIYSKQEFTGFCELNSFELVEFLKSFNSVLVTSGNLKLANSKTENTNILILENFKNVELGSEITDSQMNFYFKIDESVFKFEEGEFYQIARFLQSCLPK